LVRLSFPKGEHADVIHASGEISIGSASDNGIVLVADGVKPHHARILIDPRGCTLHVSEPGAWTHVNARPVREVAILRLGDVVSLNAVNIMLKPDNDESVTRAGVVPPAAPEAMAQEKIDKETAYRQSPPKVVLRGVSGPYFGKVVGIHGRLVIGRGADCDLVLDEPEMSRRHAMIEVNASEIFLRDLGSTNGTFVNGVQVRDAVLFTGDQLAFDRNRFLIEAPGMPVRKAVTPASAAEPEAKGQPQVTQTMRAIRLDQSAPAAAPRAQAPAPKSTPTPAQPAAGGWNLWLLILVGALLALGIALLFSSQG
jgi:pSer/pThr/pTyr-binding forkhead associated (FHA) protein